jgi:hypothetical protein
LARILCRVEKAGQLGLKCCHKRLAFSLRGRYSSSFMCSWFLFVFMFIDCRFRLDGNIADHLL